MQVLLMGVGPFAFRYQGNRSAPVNILIPLERQLIALQRCCWHFLYNETLQQTFSTLLSKLSKRRQIYVICPHFEEVRGGVEPWLMARWKAVLSVIELFLSLTELWLRRYKAKCVKTRCLQEGVGQFLDFRGRGRPPANILIPLERQLIALQPTVFIK